MIAHSLSPENFLQTSHYGCRVLIFYTRRFLSQNRGREFPIKGWFTHIRDVTGKVNGAWFHWQRENFLLGQMNDAVHTQPALGCGSAHHFVNVTVPAGENFSATIFLFHCRISAAWYSDFHVTTTFDSFVIA